MNIQELHSEHKPVSTVPLFNNKEGNVIALQIMKDEQLKAHTTPVPALLICILGKVAFENELGLKENLLPGDYINIAAGVSHWVKGVEKSQLVLVK